MIKYMMAIGLLTLTACDSGYQTTTYVPATQPVYVQRTVVAPPVVVVRPRTRVITRTYHRDVFGNTVVTTRVRRR